MFRLLLTRTKSTWRRVAAWCRQWFTRPTRKPAMRDDGADLPTQPTSAPENFAETALTNTANTANTANAATNATSHTTPHATSPRWLEGTASSPKGRIPWVLTPPERHYRLYIPAIAAENCPLLVMIHGCRQNAATFAEATHMNDLADQHGFAVLYPDQSDLANLHRCWNWFETETLAGRGEVAILLAMIDRAVKRAGADAENVAVAGLSSGGAVAALLAFSYPARFSSVAVHSGLAPHAADTVTSALVAMRDGAALDIDALTKRYWREHQLPPPPLLIIHGDADDRVHPKNADQLFDLWAGLNQAESPHPLSRSRHEVAATSTQHAHHITRLLRPESARHAPRAHGRAVVASVRINQLQHAWSGGNAALPFNDARGPDASRMIVEFVNLDQRIDTASALQ